MWDYRHGDFVKFNNLLINTDWSFLYHGTVDERADTFISKFLIIAEQCIPTKYITIRPNDKPWYNSELRRTSRKRDRLKKTALNSGKPSDWQSYKRCRNKVNNMKKYAKEIFFNNLEFSMCEMNSTNPREYWKTLKLLVKDNSKSCNSIPPLRNTDGSYSISDEDKANVLNDFFISISSLDDTNTVLPDFFPITLKSIENIDITESEITDILSNLVTKKASGPDEVSHRMLKETSKSVCIPLRILFNRSLRESIYPSAWKIANVMPLFKKGEKDIPSNYRPISLISCIGKVMERVIFKHIYNYLHENNLIYKNQSGFLPGHSTVYQLIDIYNQICKAFDEKKSTCMVFCDIFKAFDRVWHKGLIFKLKQYGISGNLLNWLSHYLTNRNQKVFIGSSYSSTKFLNAGVPQGSVLGPLLFLIYVNDIAEPLLSSTRLFADDSSLAVSSSDIRVIERTLNGDLHKILNWSKQWLVNFNPSKTEVVFFSLNHTAPPSLKFDNVTLNFVEHHKHLGVILSNNGQWHEQITCIIKSANKLLGSMKLLQFKLNRKTLNQIYISYLRPKLEYASIVWDSCTNYEKDSLERLQYEAARIVTGLTRSVSIIKLLKEIGWMSLSDRRKMQKLILVYKNKRNELPSYLHELFPPLVQNRFDNENNPYFLRNNNDYITMPQRLEIYSRSILPASLKLWNDLDTEIRESSSLSMFKRKIKNLFKSQDVPSFYKSGTRYLVVHHARLRNNCSNLFADLFINHLRDSPICQCGKGIENAEHYFFKCTSFLNERIELFRNTRELHPLSTSKLLFGNDTLNDEQNKFIFNEVHKFIKNTRRFSNNEDF